MGKSKDITERLKEMTKARKENQDGDIRTLTDNKVRDILKCEPENVDKNIFYMKLNQAKLGMVYIRDREIMKRVGNGQMIRVINFITSNEDEKASYIKATMPELMPGKLEG